MKKTATHIIGRQRYQVDVSSQQEAEKVFAWASEFNRTRFSDIWQQELAKYDRPDVVISLDKLHIDLGEVTFHDLENRLIQEIRKELARMFTALPPTAENPGEQPQAMRDMEALLFFLRRGYLPWWVAKDLSLSRILQTELEQRPQQLANELLPLLNRLDIQQRLAYQFEEKQVQQVATLLSASPFAADSNPLWIFISTGRPVAAYSRVSLEQLLQTALRQQPRQLCQQLRAADPKVDIVARLIGQFSTALLDSLANVLAGAHITVYQDLRKIMVKCLAAAHLSAPITPAEWTAYWLYALLPVTTTTDFKEQWIGRILDIISDDRQISYAHLVKVLTRAPAAITGNVNSLQQQLPPRQQRQLIALLATEMAAPTNESPTERQLRIWQEWLLTEEATFVDPNQTVDQLWNDLLERDASATLAVLRQQAENPTLYSRLIAQLTEETLQKTVHSINKKGLPLVPALHKAVTEVWRGQGLTMTNDRIALWSTTLPLLFRYADFAPTRYLQEAIAQYAKRAKVSALVFTTLLLVITAKEKKQKSVYKSLRPLLTGLVKQGEMKKIEATDISKLPATPVSSRSRQKLEAFLTTLPDQQQEWVSQLATLQQVWCDGIQTRHWPQLRTYADWEKWQLDSLRQKPAIMALFYRETLSVEHNRENMLRHFSPKLWHKIAEVMGPDTLTDAWAIHTDWQKKNDYTPAQTTAIERLFYTVYWELLTARENQPFQRASFARAYLQGVAQATGSTDNQLTVQLENERGRTAQQAFWRSLLPLTEKTATMAREEFPTPASDDTAEMLFVTNAGLVLLAPYLPRLFQMVGLTIDNHFSDEDAAIRGVQLLQYLATGSTEFWEGDLVLNKILCGVPINLPMSRAIELTELETETCSSLLQAVLQNWPRMEQSSVDNLRGSFLLREGGLKQTEQLWQLQVASAAYDILLGFVPWTFTVIQMPWMSKRIDVQWKTDF